MSKRLAVYLIGAGPLALKMFEWAHQLGLLVIATDKDKNAPGKNVLIEGLFRNGRIKQIALQNESNKKRMLLKYLIQ